MKALSAYLPKSIYLNLSDFLRGAIREKLQREAPRLFSGVHIKKEELD
jgi:hypothetical protein